MQIAWDTFRGTLVSLLVVGHLALFSAHAADADDLSERAIVLVGEVNLEQNETRKVELIQVFALYMVEHYSPDVDVNDDEIASLTSLLDDESLHVQAASARVIGFFW